MTQLDFTHSPLIMGIINVTPDSFSGDGVMREQDLFTAALNQAKQMLGDGAHILDIGGESTRPGSTPINAEEEMRRVIPVIQMIRDTLGQQPLLSIDTTKAAVAKAALEAGADMVNDVSALQADVEMAGIVAKASCSVVLMHNRTRPAAIQQSSRIGGQFEAGNYSDVVEDVKNDLLKSAAQASKAGIEINKIILDPGLGFGKSVKQNLDLIKHLPSIKQLGFPVLMGPSRKSFIGATLDLQVDERLEGTAATVAISAFLGANIIRVHDVKFMARVCRMAHACSNLQGT